MFVVVVGDPFEGLEIYGSFETPEEAAHWADEVLKPRQIRHVVEMIDKTEAL